ncbi:PIN domain-containing protein [Halobacteriales archaeon Cl-PHB]
MYVETDFLVALLKDDDWLQEPALEALANRDDIHTSILAYAEVLVLVYDRDLAAYDIDVARAVANLLELVPVEPTHHEEAVLAAASYIEDHELTPFDALHAGLATVTDEAVLSSEGDYETVGLELLQLETYGDQ